MKLADRYPHYYKGVQDLDTIDVYRVITLWEITDPCLQHALKKVMAAGQRGAKNAHEDIQEAIHTLQRKLEMMDEDAGLEVSKEPYEIPLQKANPTFNYEPAQPTALTDYSSHSDEKLKAEGWMRVSEIRPEPGHRITVLTNNRSQEFGWPMEFRWDSTGEGNSIAWWKYDT